MITIVSGSHRPDSQSLKVAEYFQKRLLAKSMESSIVDLSKLNLPLVMTADSQLKEHQSSWELISHKLISSFGYVIISPEWGGMATPAIKNFFLLPKKQEMAHKPGLIVGVSASHGGAYPVSELRSSSYKNSHICFIPEHIIVRDCQNVLNNEVFDSIQPDYYLKNRIDYSIGVLIEYAFALNSVRTSGKINHTTYPNGM